MKSHECPATKLCSICQVEKGLDSFSKGRSQCKPCRSSLEKIRYSDPEYRDRANTNKRNHHHANKDRMNRISREYYAANRERMIESQKERDALRYEEKLEYERNRYANNCDSIKAVQRSWRASNKARIAERDVRRRAALQQASPSWANRAKIERIYQLAAWASRFTDEPMHVDHMHPIQGKLISGLHVENNLQIIPASENLRKSNKFG